MTKQEFKAFMENGPVILDGAMGTGLMKAGMSVDECTEKWAAEHPVGDVPFEVFVDTYKEQARLLVDAGSDGH